MTTAPTYVPLADGMRAIAVSTGVLPEEVEALWRRHQDLCRKDGSDYGGRRWKGLCEKHVADVDQGTVVPLVPRTDEEAIKEHRRKAEAQAKAAYNAWYEDHAISFEEYLDSLVTKPESECTAEELLLLENGPRRLPDGSLAEDVAAYLLRVLAPVGGRPEATAGPRTAAWCQCGRPVMTWTQDSYVYAGWQCRECRDRDRGIRERAQQRELLR